MMRPPAWPELHRLARAVRATDFFTDTLAVWSGRGVVVRVVDRADDACPDPLVADALDLHDGARVQGREARMTCDGVVVATTRCWIATGSPVLTPAVRAALRDGGGLGEALRPLRPRRVPVRVTAVRERPSGDPAVAVLAVQARLDVAGTPVAWCEETVLEALLGDDLRVGPPLRAAG